MKSLFDNYTPPTQPEQKKIRFTPRLPDFTGGDLTEISGMKLTFPDSAFVDSEKKKQKVKAETALKSSQRVRRGEETTLF